MINVYCIYSFCKENQLLALSVLSVSIDTFKALLHGNVKCNQICYFKPKSVILTEKFTIFTKNLPSKTMEGKKTDFGLLWPYFIMKSIYTTHNLL